jgi:class 3 adenylate cyclase
LPSDSFAPYVPRLLAEWDLDAPDTLWRTIDSTCCFVDISGFTALSERLARRGRIGAEELTEILNHVFSRMLAVAYEKGGSLLKFGGDALLLVFTRGEHAVLGAEAAVAMRAALREARTLATSVGRINLRMSVGLHSGDLLIFRVGDVHHELIVSGPVATITTEMEHAADAGEILISQEMASLLPKSFVGEAKDPGVLLRGRRVVEGGPGPEPMRSVPDDAAAASVPRLLHRRLTDPTAESEHRVATVGFVKYVGVDHLLAERGPGGAANAIDAVVRAVQAEADAEGVTFLASDIDANGGKSWPPASRTRRRTTKVGCSVPRLQSLDTSTSSQCGSG